MALHFMTNKFSEDLRVEIARRNIKLIEVEELTSISKATISRCSRGTGFPSVAVYATLCEFMNKDLKEYFISDTSPRNEDRGLGIKL